MHKYNRILFVLLSIILFFCITISCKSIESFEQNKKYNLVYFLSEGPPNDEGNNLIENKPIVEKNASPHFNNIQLYTPKIMRELNLETYVKDYKIPGLVTANPGMYRIGNCAWRPKIMLMELEKMKDGDILIYRDCNIKKYSVLGDYTNIQKIAETCLDICNFDVFIPRENEDVQLKNHAKTNIIRELGDDHLFTYDFPIVITNFIIIRKSNISIELLNEWNDACLVESWIDVHQYGDLHADFRWSCPEQSILGIIISNWVRKHKHNIPKKYPVIGFQDRSIQNIVYFNNYDYLRHIE